MDRKDVRPERVGKASPPGLSRRHWLQQAAVFSAAAAIPRLAFAAAEDKAPAISPVMETLSAYMAEARNRALPEKVAQETAHHILDTIAAMISGSELAPGKIAIRFARAHVGERVATVVASDAVCGAIDAALTNGMLAHSDETDDYAPLGTHPGSAVVPAAS